MNLPNKLTVLRMALVPVFLVFMLSNGIPQNYLWALIIFVIASLTDLLDGQIARKRGLVTDFGKFMDPLADKILVMAGMICFVELGYAPAFVIVIILAREFLVTSLRLVAAGSGIVIAADKWGKYKTVCQMIWIIYTILVMWLLMNSGLVSPSDQGMWVTLRLPADVLMWLSVALTVISGVNYVWKNRGCINTMQ
ncbi:CDP-diacylglycerol--glycerol-3-phosphate 3-phosphatidyltransferase [Hydrogenoanaerobacterium sp.]|uniref:CDP-diacylglycerol--glycerol-3-phosphate 3-phosphatidyltransferase n=1 Tax=Hydrogenoanaerobacterium sp. TaxID=2953763 RepID=UPI00289E9060|nr:CDP-diacylglycerol--glycerol-3-phosphate 3-phosphatidyltransferase [Hydrogenoanaerobacterium sp.]